MMKWFETRRILESPWTSGASAILLAVSASLTSGCATVGYFESPWTLMPRESEFSIAPPAVGISLQGEDAVTISGPSVRYRQGLTEKADWGLSLGGAGLGIETRYRLLEGEHGVITLSPSISGRPLDISLEEWQSQLSVPVSFGYRFSKKTEAVVSPMLVLTSLYGATPSTASVTTAGLSASVAQRVAIGLSLQPGVSITYPLAYRDGYGNVIKNDFSVDQLTFGFGLSVGFARRQR